MNSSTRSAAPATRPIAPTSSASRGPTRSGSPGTVLAVEFQRDREREETVANVIEIEFLQDADAALDRVLGWRAPGGVDGLIA